RSDTLSLHDALPIFPKAVVYGHHLEGRGMKSSKDLGHGIAQAAVHLVLLAGDSATSLLYRSEDGFDIERLYRVHVDQFNADTHLCQCSLGLNRNPYHVTAGEYRHVST